jgi:hypothetical protein
MQVGRFRYLAPLLVFITTQLYAQDPIRDQGDFEVTEHSLMDLAKGEASATVSRINSTMARSNLGLANLNDEHRWQLFGVGSFTKSNRDASKSLMPVMSPIESYEVGFQKKLRYGASTSVSAFSEKNGMKGSPLDGTATSGVKLGLELDIWQNIFGRLDRAKLSEASLIKERSEIEAKIELARFHSNLRKIYWSLVANQESYLVTDEMRKAASLQLAEAKKRFAASVADRSEVARYESQLSSRVSALTVLEYEREKLKSQLKMMLPTIAERSLKLGAYEIDKAIADVMQCTAVISTTKEVPWNNTRVDELLAVHDKAYGSQSKVSDARGGGNAALFSELSYAGTDKGFGESYNEFQKDPRDAYTVGLKFSVPIGATSSAAETALKALERDEFLVQKLNWEAEVKGRHAQMLPLITYLNTAFINQEKNSQHLSQAIKATQKLYDQARVSVDAIINDQSSFLASKLDQIRTRLAIVHEVLDYLQVYDQTPCEFNVRSNAERKG